MYLLLGQLLSISLKMPTSVFKIINIVFAFNFFVTRKIRPAFTPEEQPSEPDRQEPIQHPKSTLPTAVVAPTTRSIPQPEPEPDLEPAFAPQTPYEQEFEPEPQPAYEPETVYEPEPQPEPAYVPEVEHEVQAPPVHNLLQATLPPRQDSDEEQEEQNWDGELSFHSNRFFLYHHFTLWIISCTN